MRKLFCSKKVSSVVLRTYLGHTLFALSLVCCLHEQMAAITRYAVAAVPPWSVRSAGRSFSPHWRRCRSCCGLCLVLPTWSWRARSMCRGGCLLAHGSSLEHCRPTALALPPMFAACAASPMSASPVVWRVVPLVCCPPPPCYCWLLAAAVERTAGGLRA